MSRLDVIFEDSQILVVNKPAGIVTNRSDTTHGVKTLQDLVEQHLGTRPPKNRLIEQRKEGEWESLEEAFTNRSGIVHRLDKETSGILLVAKTLEAFETLQKEFKERIVEKSYIALSHGKIVPETGEISVPVGRLTFNRKRFGVVAGGRESYTLYKTISNFKFQMSNGKYEDVTLVELFPKTGRTHQIRVHLQYIGHPIFGDELYTGRKVSKNDRKILPRVFLHAASISFIHPASGKTMHFQASLPEELEHVIASLTVQLS